MLTKPDAGWTYFSLSEEYYPLSYLTEIPKTWLKEAITGLETMKSFTVSGCCEPGHFRCTVDWQKCHITAEVESDDESGKMHSVSETLPVDMVTFCRMLYEDLNNHLLEWAKWSAWIEDANQPEVLKKMEELKDNLKHLEKLLEGRNARAITQLVEHRKRIERMRNGEKLKCPRCKAEAFGALGNPETSKVFRCSQCGCGMSLTVPMRIK